ncbi:coiled-coil domain-containing protein 96-like [Selaginella moellendorffii]|uniref:coiled-coil domain-containing protein 96-like n=1 Tax=Selaginella moellendorffii TaxID=88036 RepID=UPI000D1C5F5B|nr:coiled-coil domain-containing protein 96-like [Selaginella moellendorffii]|eukprot:XP_024519399.1 coiled-coil domain-containing protein 96-like [Selaginella moellendorffii]
MAEEGEEVKGDEVKQGEQQMEKEEVSPQTTTTDPSTSEGTKDEAPQAEERHQVMFHIEETMEEIGDLQSENKVLEKRLLALQKRRSTIGTKLFLEGAETLYQARLTQWKNLKEEIDRLVLEYDERIEDMQEQVREKQEEAKAMRSEFLAYKWQMAREAEHSITGKPLKPKLLAKLQAEENDLDAEIETLRIQGKQLKTQLKKLEQALWKKEQLPGGLHLVDFEQLKIENESLNEKLSKKNDELFQLKKKSTHVVHVLTHVREKLQYVQKETETDAKALETVDSELLAKRKELHRVKAMCKTLRAKMAKMQEDIVNVTNPALLDDLELHKENVEAFERKLRELKGRHAVLTKKNKELHRQLQDSLTMGNYVIGNPMQAETTGPTNSLRWGSKRDVLKKKFSGALNHI